jgi:SAM-dependent methyltransferase
MLPVGDLTPTEFTLPQDSFVEKFKKPIRRFGYPIYNLVVHKWISNTHGRNISFHVDQWLWGQRGNDYERHRRRVNHYLPLVGKKVMIAGCGTGRDIKSWLPFRPEIVIGVDYFNYLKAWKLFADKVAGKYSKTKVVFQQGDLTNLSQFSNELFDVIGSDAVFEHVNELFSVLKEFHRLLKPGGIVYATFGPLWYCWGGDHISGYDGLAGGYNHILLKRDDYEHYLNEAGPFEHSEHDGRTWIKNGLFSYLKPKEYIGLLNACGFERVFTAAIIEPRAVKYLDMYDEQRRHLENLVSDPLDLLITCMTIIYRKRPGE